MAIKIGTQPNSEQSNGDKEVCAKGFVFDDPQ